ncbi:MAG: PD-(D/E)XK nuclease family protein, partial [Pyramidobacter sp.]|nr:PD-(D/E)XK nuclease family protein [Pyramidobacter sp.]
MPLQLFTCRRVEDLGPALRGLPPKKGRVFLVAASGDRELLARLLEGTPHDYQVRRWDEIYRSFAETLDVKDPRVQLDPPDHWLLLHTIMKRFLDRGGRLPPGALRRGFLTLLGTQIRELIREEIAPDSVAGAYESGDALGAAFVELYRDYLTALDERGLSDSAGVTTQTRLLLDREGARAACAELDLALVGFSSFTHSQLALLRELNRMGATIRVFSPVADLENAYGAAEQFGETGVALSRRRPFAACLVEGGDPRQELETCARSLALWEQGEGTLAAKGKWPGWEKIALCVPRARITQAREVFSRYGLPCAWNFRLKVTETPLWHVAVSCLEAASGGWQTESVLRLLAEPWLCGQTPEADRLREKRPRGLASWRRVLEGESLAAFESCASFAAAMNAGGTALELLRALRRFAGGMELRVSRLIRDFPELDEPLALFCESLRELDRKILFVTEVVRDLGRYGEQKLSGADARAFLAAWADGTTVAQAEGGSGCAAVFADVPPTLFSAPYVFLLGCDAGSWPGSLKESPVLDERCKTKLHESSALGLDRSHLPLLGEQRTQREFLFRRLIACASRLAFVCSSTADANDRPQEMTAFLDAAARDGWVRMDPSPVVRTLDGILPAPDEAVLVPVEARRPDLRVENSLPLARSRPGRLELRGTQARFSSVDDYAACPYFFALRHLLCLPEPPRDGEYDAPRGGSAVHALWERAWRDYAASGAQGTIVERTKALFDATVEAVYPELIHSPALRRDRERLKWQTERLAARQDEL